MQAETGQLGSLMNTEDFQFYLLTKYIDVQ